MNRLPKISLPPWRLLHVRLALIGVALFVLVQAVGYVLVQQHFERSLYFSERDTLRNGEAAVNRLATEHIRALIAQGQVLAAQTEVVQALRRGEHPALPAGLGDGKSLAFVVWADDKLHAPPDESTLRNKALNELAQAYAAGKSDGDAFGRIVVHDWQALCVAAVPVMTPQSTGWIVLAERVDDAWLREARQLTQLGAVLAIRPADGAWKPMASTLGVDDAGALLKVLAPLNNDPRPGHRGAQARNEPFYATQVKDDAYAARLVDLSATQEGGALGDELGIVLLDPASDPAEAFDALKLSLLVVGALGAALIGMVIAAMGQQMTRSVRALTAWARTTVLGQYSGLPRVRGKSEMSELLGALDDLRKKVREREADMLNLAYRDPLTHLPNREKFRASVLKAIAQAATTQTPVSVLMLDLDRFKHVNDILGHQFGDRMLRLVAQRLKDDVIEREMVLARLSGDEFAVLMPGADAASAKKVAKLIHQTLLDPITLDDQTIDLSAGIGVASYPAHAAEADLLLNHCEVAMYAAKQHAATVVYTPKLDSGSQDSLSLLGELRQALEQGQLRLYFQPKVNLLTGEVIGAEALVRWQHPQRGMVPPTQFIPFAEQTGFVRNLSYWMLDRTAQMWRKMRQQGLTVRLSVNLSARDLLDQHLPDKIEKILARYRVHQGGLTLEITESATMDDPERALGILERLHKLGLKLSIDDFGTGYSSLAYLKRLPVDELKIDKSFVMNMERDIHDAKIVRSTIDLAHNLGLNVVAEGLENIQAWKLLHGLRCDEGQGYYVARPMPADEFVAWAKQWQAPDIQDVALSTSFAALL